MKRLILNLGKSLNKAQQKKINGGYPQLIECYENDDCRFTQYGPHARCINHKCRSGY